MIRESQFVILNELIKKIYTMEDYTEMRRSLLDMLTTIIPCKVGTFYLSSKNSQHLLGSPVGIGVSEDALQLYIDKYEDTDYTRWIFMSGKTMVYRETDLFPDEVREQFEWYQQMYCSSGLYYSAQMSIACNGLFQGVISLYRKRTEDDFSDSELLILDLLKTHLEHRAQKELESIGSIKNKVYFDAFRFMTQYNLTAREVEVLGLLLAGLSLESICESLVISSNTLKKHTLRIYKKLGINNRWELINFK